jgi:hypothetical protein
VSSRNPTRNALRTTLSPSAISLVELRDGSEPGEGEADNVPGCSAREGGAPVQYGYHRGMSSSDRSGAAWLLRIDLDFADRRFGADTVNRLLEDGRAYADGPRLDAGRLGAALVRDHRDPLPNPRSVDPNATAIALRVRLHEDDLELACACSRGRPYVCEHVMRVLVDVAVHRRLRDALTNGEEVMPSLVDELPALDRKSVV